jgi:hypothetical protein
LGESSFTVRRTNPRFAFFAEAEATLRDGTSVPAQLCELSSQGCYIDTFEPIPIGAQVRLRIYRGESTCELLGKVIYLHSGASSMGLFGMGVTFGEIDAKQRSAIDAWLRELAAKRASPL